MLDQFNINFVMSRTCNLPYKIPHSHIIIRHIANLHSTKCKSKIKHKMKTLQIKGQEKNMD